MGETRLVNAKRGSMREREPGSDPVGADVNFSSILSLDNSGGWHVLRISREGIVTCDVAAQKVLKQFFADCPPWKDSLPVPLANAFLESRDWGLNRTPSRSWRTFNRVLSGMKLTANYIPDQSGGYVVLKSGRTVAAVDASALPLTKREKQIVTLVAAGKTNIEISLVLDISARTVQKHLENTFRKLGVESRMALAMRATA
jgi:DNA-binding CsgD family transcriptional regulator